MLSAATLGVTLHMLLMCEATCIPPMGNVSYVLGGSRKQYSTSTNLCRLWSCACLDRWGEEPMGEQSRTFYYSPQTRVQFFHQAILLVPLFVSETHVTFRFCKEQADNHTEHEGNQRTNTKNRSYQLHACLLPTQGKYKVHTSVEFFFFSEYSTTVSKLARQRRVTECV